MNSKRGCFSEKLMNHFSQLDCSASFSWFWLSDFLFLFIADRYFQKKRKKPGKKKHNCEPHAGQKTQSY